MKETKERISAVPTRGMRDFLPEEVSFRQVVMTKIKEVYESYGFSEIETPIVERSELLNAGEGGENEKQTFALMKRGMTVDDIKNSSSLTELIDGGLRFDLTVPLARYYANNQAKLPKPFKVLQTGSVFRAERPQKGRYRQFTQCDIDIIGDESSLAERELILATAEALLRVEFSNFTVRINDRRILKGIVESCGYKEEEFETVFIIIDKLDKIGLDGVENELRLKVETEPSTKLLVFLRKVFDNAENSDLFEFLPEKVDKDVVLTLKQIIETVAHFSNNKYKIIFDPTLVRGMGYYTGPIFEIRDENFPSSIAGGGRYDKMIGKYSSENVPACGLSIGFERIMSILEEKKTLFVNDVVKRVVIYNEENVSYDFILNFAMKSRNNGAVVLLQKQKKNTKKQLDDLLALGFGSYCLVDSENSALGFKDLK